jgi:glyoxylase-like metal-dependent hydrolase (beta-lactamase superfamily II)
VKQDECWVTIVSYPFEQNTYIANLKGCNKCIIIDPGLEPGKIVQHLEKHSLEPAAMLLTHGHSDHIGGCGVLKDRWPDCPIGIGAADAPKLTDPRQNLSAAFGVPLVCPPADILFNDGDKYEAAGFSLQVRTIPGHSVGHVVFLWEGEPTPVVWVGDAIFAGSIGRTDFPDGDFRELISGIHTKLFTLPDATILLPGHGPATTVGEEKRSNPYASLKAHG